MNLIKEVLKSIKEFIRLFFQYFIVKVLAIVHIGSKNFWYLLSKFVCFAIFFIPFIIFEIYDFFISLTYWHLYFVPLLAPFVMLFKIIFDHLGTSLFYLVTLPDIIFKIP